MITIHTGTANFNTGGPFILDKLVIDGGTANFNSGAPVTTTDLTFAGYGTLKGASDITVTGLLAWRGGDMVGSGKTISKGNLIIDGGDFLGRTLENQGTATWSGGGIAGDYGAVLRNTAGGTFDITNGLSFVWCGSEGCATYGPQPKFVNEGTLTKSVNSTTRFWSFEEGFGGPVDFRNSGTVVVQSGTLDFGGGYTQTGGATRLSGGSILSASTININGGILSGTGIITGTVSNAGTIEVGGSGTPGTLTIANGSIYRSPADGGPINIPGVYIQTMTGTLGIKLGGPLPGTQFDQLVVDSGATLDGTLNIRTINDFAPGSNNSFQVIVYGSCTGTFSTLNGNGRIYTPTYGATHLTISLP